MMASVPIEAFPTTVSEQAISGGFAHSRRKPMRAAAGRRPTQEQGRSLEILAHAIEYLVDSGFSAEAGGVYEPPSEAVRILVGLNRDVFFECKEIVPVSVRLKQRLWRWFERKPHHARVAPAASPRRT